jgi:hypothetical protein
MAAFALITTLLVLSSPEDQMRRAAQTNEHQKYAEEDEVVPPEPYVSADYHSRTYTHISRQMLHLCRMQRNIKG